MAKQLPPLYALRAFESAARAGSTTLAAEELGITQSAISKHIKTLENYFGCKLFVRNGPKIESTPQGQIFATDLKRGFKHIEEACSMLREQRAVLRLKAPSTLTMRWLLACLSDFRAGNPGFDVQISSVWMDIDTVDFFSEPYDCAILLGSGSFGPDTKNIKLFDEWLIPICAPDLILDGKIDLSVQELIHPSPDRRDWRRWLKRAGLAREPDITRGQVFDTLEQGNAAAIAGHGVSVGDLALCERAIKDGQVALPIKIAVGTGDGYYLVWPENSRRVPYIWRFHEFLQASAPNVDYPDIAYLK